MNIGLAVIATGKYDCFLPALWQSAKSHFLPQHDVRLFVLTDKTLSLPGATTCRIEHELWPGPTLHRYRSLLRYREELTWADHLFMCDADMRFVSLIGDEVFGKLVAVRHPGFFQVSSDIFTYERNPASRAYIAPGTGTCYFAGGFQGGEVIRYLEAVRDLSERIRLDEEDGIIAVWHDESHWNRYLIDFLPQTILSPSYCYPEGWSIPFEQKLLALNKRHAEMRS